jgi:hypothetical protein
MRQIQVIVIHDAGPNWWAVVLDGLLSSIIAAGIALLVVYLTRRGDKHRDQLATSHAASESLTRVLNATAAGLARGEPAAIEAWSSEVTVQEPVLFQDELSRRIRLIVENVSDFLNEDDEREAFGRRHPVHDDQIQMPVAYTAWRLVRGAAVLELCKALGASFAAHRHQAPLPVWPVESRVSLRSYMESQSEEYEDDVQESW